MNLEQINEMWTCCKPKQNDIATQTQINTFNKLCEKAKCLLWQELASPQSCFLYVLGLSDDLLELSPIEQIMYVAFEIFIFKCRDIFPISFDAMSQREITIGNKTYRADFLIDSILICDVEYACEKPILVECDGYASHHTKEQRNHDVERENNLKMGGYSIIRFTGSQVYNNPYDCVMRVFKFLMDENNSVIKQAYIEHQKERKNAKKND